MSKPIRGTLVETYLRSRGIDAVHDAGALRFHARCYHRPDNGAPTETRPAMISIVTDVSGAVTGAHRTWLAPDGLGKARIDTPRRAMGNLLGHAVRFGAAGDIRRVPARRPASLADCPFPGMFYRPAGKGKDQSGEDRDAPAPHRGTGSFPVVGGLSRCCRRPVADDEDAELHRWDRDDPWRLPAIAVPASRS